MSRQLFRKLQVPGLLEVISKFNGPCFPATRAVHEPTRILRVKFADVPVSQLTGLVSSVQVMRGVAVQFSQLFQCLTGHLFGSQTGFVASSASVLDFDSSLLAQVFGVVFCRLPEVCQLRALISG